MGTNQFCAPHTAAVIEPLLNSRLFEFAMKTGPAASGVKFAPGIEQGVAAANTVISAPVKMITVLTAERRLSSRLAGYPVLLIAETGPPILFRLHDLVHGFILSFRHEKINSKLYKPGLYGILAHSLRVR